MSNNILKINEVRFKDYLDTLSCIGINANGGIHRTAFSEAHQEARRQFRLLIIENGLGFRIDGAGNQIAQLPCVQSDAKTLILGSHLDSVPDGGKFDGVLGVVAAFEVILTLKDTGVNLPFNLEVIDFTDEEGTYISLLGSSSFTGKLKSDDLLKPHGGQRNFHSELQKIGLTESGILTNSCNPSDLLGYVELHIEQGSFLENADIDIGIVKSIVGIGLFEIVFMGQSDHAGTKPMVSRKDASLGACLFANATKSLVIENYPECVCNVGNMSFLPGANNIVPEQVTVSLEFRAPEESKLMRLKQALTSLAKEIAKDTDLGVEIRLVGMIPPTVMSKRIQNIILKSATDLELKTMLLSSGAGHDAQSFASLCPTGMIFVPSVGGASHSPREFTQFQDCVNGANILLNAVIELTSQISREN